MIRRLILAVVATALPAAATAAEGLSLSSSLRGRYETVTGQARVGPPRSETLVSFRTILTAEYGAGPVRLVGELWDSRSYGAKLGGSLSTSDVNAVEPVQLYLGLKLKDPLGAGSKGELQAGRFMMNLGSRRLVAADDYRNTTNGSTGLRLDLAKRGAAVSVFYVLPQIRLPDGQPDLLQNTVRLDRESSNLKLWGGIAAAPVKALGTVEATFLGLEETDAPGRPTRDRNLRTLDTRIVRNPAPRRFDYEAEGAYQYGEISANAAPGAAQQKVSAWFLHLDAGYQFAGRWKPRLSVEYDQVSGDDSRSSYGHFDTLYGMRRADFAVSGLYNAISRANLSTPGLRLEVAPTARLDAYLTLRDMWLASATDAFSATNVRDPTGRSGRHAGEQLEGRVRYWLVPDALRFEADAAWLHKGRFLETAPNRPPPHDTAYLSLNLTANF